MTDHLKQQMLRTWADHFGLPCALFGQPGTTLIEDATLVDPRWLILWRIGLRTVIRSAPVWIPELRDIIAHYPDAHALVGADFPNHWGGVMTEQEKFYALDENVFRPFMPDSRYIARILTSVDQAVFDDFQSRCSAEDRDMGEVGLDHELATGVLDGERIVAAASMYEWRGFSDIGVLTDPAYRRQGLGKAAVSYLCQALLNQQHDRVICYRHELANVGSQGIAEGLNLRMMMWIDSVQLPVR